MPRHIPLASALVSGLAIASGAIAGEPPRPKCWIRIADSPYPTYESAIAYDIVRDRVVLYGGENNPTGNTWEWNGTGWTGSPVLLGTRSNHEMAFDHVAGRVMLFGSGSFSAASNTYGWTGTQWAVIATTGPQPRVRFSMVSDSARQRVVLFGGAATQGSIDNRTWEWNGASWSVASTMGPSLRSETGAAFDAKRGRTILFGGQSPSGTFFSETWEWDGANWRLMPTVISPSQVRYGAMAYSPARERVVLHGGYAPPNLRTTETWSWDGQQWRLETSHGPLCGVAEMVYDPLRSRLVMTAMIDLPPLPDAGTWALADCPGDVNADGAVDFADLNAVLSNFGQEIHLGVPGDLDGDGIASFADLNQVLSYFGSQGCE